MHLECVFILLAVAGISPSSQAPLNLADETGLRESFLRRCDDVQATLYPDLLDEKKDCSLLWDKFRAAAIISCPTGPESFTELMRLADHRIPADKSVFWSGVHSQIERLEKLNGFFLLEKTLMGYTMNYLKFCASKCKSEGGSKACNTFIPFWVAASKWFASKAVGRVSVILNASLETPFRETTTFGKYELPLISPARVTSMDIYLLNSLNDPVSRDACNNPSVQKLRTILRDKGIAVRCAENPDFLMRLVCADQPDALRCRPSDGSSPGADEDDF